MPHHAPSPQPLTLQQFWRQQTGHEYLSDGYFEGDGSTTPPTPVLRLELVRQSTMSALAKQMKDLNSTQARRFFGHCRALESQLLARRITWPQCHVSLHSMAPIAVSSFVRKNIPAMFRDFILANLEACREERDFLAGFLPHFEALIGFGAACFTNKQ